jgi:hypothetical protein
MFRIWLKVSLGNLRSEDVPTSWEATYSMWYVFSYTTRIAPWDIFLMKNARFDLGTRTNT